MNLARAQRRVDRSYWRYIHAKGCWRKAWQEGFAAAVSARNAIKLVGLVRRPASSRAELTGLRQEAHGVLATSGEQSTTTVGNRSRGV
jgi:hypothetical protein